MILRAIEHSLPWERVQWHARRDLGRHGPIRLPARRCSCLSDVVVEYKPAPEPHDLVWARQAVLTSDDRKVTNLKVRRVARNATPTSTGPTDTARP